MKWEESAHSVRAAASVLDEDEVVVLGSQAILAYFTPLGTQRHVVDDLTGRSVVNSRLYGRRFG